MAYTPWQLCRPPVSVAVARRIHDVRHEMTMLVLEVGGHAELLGSFRAAAAAVDECARIAMRDVERAAVLKKQTAVPKKKARRK